MLGEIVHKQYGYDDVTPKHDYGWVIIEELYETPEEEVFMYAPSNNFWIMLRCDGEFYPHGKFRTLQKAMKRLEMILNEEIEPFPE